MADPRVEAALAHRYVAHTRSWRECSCGARLPIRDTLGAHRIKVALEAATSEVEADLRERLASDLESHYWFAAARIVRGES